MHANKVFQTHAASLAWARFGAVASQSLTVSLSAAGSPAAMVSLSPGFQAGAGEPALHFAVGKAQAAMGIIVAQEFQLMRREIGDQKPPARRHHPRRFGHRRAGIVEIMQHLMEQHGIEAASCVAGGKGRR